MANELARAKLARAAQALNARRKSRWPALVLMTDDDRLLDPVRAARALPRGSMIIIRARDAVKRGALVSALLPIAKARRFLLLVANDGSLSLRRGVAGQHAAEADLHAAARWRAKHAGKLVTTAAHSMRACARASRCGADVVLLSPVFVTESHRGTAALGAARARLIARQSPMPVYALGGIGVRQAIALKNSSFIGLAAIGALDPSEES